MFINRVQPLTTPGTREDLDEWADATTEGMWNIIIHNDDITPYLYVILILEQVFLLSDEMAEHVTWVAHNEGQAIVAVRPRAEAQRLIDVAHGRARTDGFPLTFSMEPE